MRFEVVQDSINAKCSAWTNVLSQTDRGFFMPHLISPTRLRSYSFLISQFPIPYPRLKETAIRLAERFKPRAILIEDASTGIALAQELKQAGTFAVRAIPVERDKKGRVYVQEEKFEAGKVFFPRNASWLPALEAELLTFSNLRMAESKSAAGAYRWRRSMRTKSQPRSRTAC